MADKEMRAVYTETLMRLAAQDKRIVILEADLMRATGTGPFKNAYPQRTFNAGVAEANMVGTAAGLSAAGKIPFAATFGCFASRRAFDQFFISANYARLNVKLIGVEPGVSAAFNGGTHMPFEDIGMMRLIPGLTIFEPSDPVSLEKLLEASAAHQGCTYMRLPRKVCPTLYGENDTFALGKSKVLREGKDLAIFALGAILVNESLKAAETLKEAGIDAAVIDAISVKPLDRELILSYAAKTGRILTAENCQLAGGFGSAVAELLSQERPTPMAMVGVQDEFGEVGTQDYLIQRFKLDSGTIAERAKTLMKTPA